MKQVQFSAFGPPSQVARCVDVADVGRPAAWEVVVKVDAFPINPADLAMLAGRYGKLPRLPAQIGMEACGHIVEKGKDVVELEIGDRVVIIANNNWAQRRRVPANAVHKVPADGSPVPYSMLKVNPATAQLLLTRFTKLNPQDWIIQNAPLSSVGRCVMQIAKSFKLRTVNVVRRPESITEVIACGGDVAIVDSDDLSQQVRNSVGNRPILLALDAVAGPGVQRLADCLSDGGQIINYGMLSGMPCEVRADQTIFRKISLQGFWVSNVLNSLTLDERRTIFSHLSELISTGKLIMPVDSTFPLSNLEEALRRAEQGGRTGKVIVEVN